MAWFNLASSTSSHLYSRSDLYEAEEEVDSEEELSPEFLCPFCGEDFDFVGLCCHLDDEHVLEVKTGVCPVCDKRVGGKNLLGHIIEQHSNLLKVQPERRYCKSGSSNLALSMLKKQIQEGNQQHQFSRSSHAVSLSSLESDQLLSSFLRNQVVIKEESVSSIPQASVDERSENAPALEASSERTPQQSSAMAKDSDQDAEESARKCEFVRGLLLSTFLGDDGL